MEKIIRLFKEINWKTVLYWFVFMFLFNVILFPLVFTKEPITLSKVITGFVSWFIFGIIMSFISKPKGAAK
ncbi:hypothetical protein [Flavobacterium saliperosum]|uniref:Uncharacterized protein n=1 Tax=Flavobacterium saliperosum TaxID=329186 RepID=A0A1G4W810_9FLAO|nr:hypothetical protein [Flavobacterium saliperosum]SCX18288.1 hypothetical protein SAMN02927925_02661 [Flavobacterium saliperosum]